MLYKLACVIMLIASLLFIIVLTAASSASTEVPTDLAKDKLTLCREAWLSWRNQLRTGSGEGVFEHYVEGKLIAKAQVKVCFAPNRYRVEMDFKKSSNKDTKQLAIYNTDNVLFHVRYFPVNNKINIKEGNCYNIQDVSMPPIEAGFPFSPCHPIMAIDSTVMEYPDIILHRIEDDRLFVLRYQNSNVHLQITVSKKYGYNVASIRSYRDGFNSQIASREEISWDKQNGVWFINTIEREHVIFENGKPSGKNLYRFSYSNFTANPEIDNKIFSIDSAGLPEGARILDNRPQATERVYHYTRKRVGKEEDKGIFSEIHQLPRWHKRQSNRDLNVTHRERSAHRRRIVLSIVGIFFILLGVMVWRLKSRLKARNV